ncbi:MAG: hypothetical protein PUG96_04625, partial [Prevotellaceae bacterium]|nr:hypothetical protein [Prevotellaceae bacterium]
LLYLSLSYKNFLTWQSPGLGKSGLCLYFSAVLYVKREAAPILTQPHIHSINSVLMFFILINFELIPSPG